MNNTSNHGSAYRTLVIAGGTCMLAAVAVEVVAVVGRFVGMPLPGSIELVQVLVTVSGTAALVIATLADSHARVRLILDRLLPSRAQALVRINQLLAAVFFLFLLAGSVWVAADMWSGHEQTEIWRVSYRPLRILVALGCLGVVVLFIRRCLGRLP